MLRGPKQPLRPHSRPINSSRPLRLTIEAAVDHNEGPRTVPQVLAVMLLLAATVGDGAKESPEPQNAIRGQYATIRPTHRLTPGDTRTVRKTPVIPGVPARKSGNISPLRRELPQAVVQPPKTRRRSIGW